MKKEDKKDWEKKYWEKPTVKCLSVKGTTKSGQAVQKGENTEPGWKKGWSS